MFNLEKRLFKKMQWRRTSIYRMDEKIIKQGSKEYIIDNERDLMIFNSVKDLEKKKLSNSDKKIVKLIKTQLEDDWRKYLVNELKKLLIKYKLK